MTAVTAVPTALETIHILLKNSRWIPHLKLTCSSCLIEKLSEMTSRPLRTRLAWFAGHDVLSNTCKIAVSPSKLAIGSACTFSRLPVASAKWLLRESPQHLQFHPRGWLQSFSKPPSCSLLASARSDPLPLTILDAVLEAKANLCWSELNCRQQGSFQQMQNC